MLIERSAIGGQAGSSSKIENYLGFPEGISGAELAERAKEQACRFGTEILIAREGVRGELLPGKMIGHLADGGKIVSRRDRLCDGRRACAPSLAESRRVHGRWRVLWRGRE